MLLMDRIRGTKTQAPLVPESPDFILNNGAMTIKELDRRIHGGSTRLGTVKSKSSQACLGMTSGNATSQVGLGLSLELAD